MGEAPIYRLRGVGLAPTPSDLKALDISPRRGPVQCDTAIIGPIFLNFLEACTLTKIFLLSLFININNAISLAVVVTVLRWHVQRHSR